VPLTAELWAATSAFYPFMPNLVLERDSKGRRAVAMISKWLVLAVGLTAAIAFMLHEMPRDQPSVASLQRQLAGEHCHYRQELYEAEGCRRHQLNLAQRLFLSDEECELWAVRCLGELRSPDAVSTLIGVLDTKADIETCDGVIPVRSTAVSLLGEIGDKSAIDPLKRLMMQNPKTKLSIGASGCNAQFEGIETVKKALSKLEK